MAAVGAPTTWGAAPFRDQTFSKEATVTRKLRDAGALLVAKLVPFPQLLALALAPSTIVALLIVGVIIRDHQLVGAVRL